MGTESSLNGTIDITPVPRVSDYSLEKLKADKSVGWGYECVKVDFDKQNSFETEDDGTEVTRTRVIGAYIQACGQGGHKHYHILQTLRALVEMLGSEREYSGYLEYLDEYGVQKRYAIVNGVAREYEPKIVWPDEVA